MPRKKTDDSGPATETADYPQPRTDLWTLEDLLVSDYGFRLESAMPCQRALCRILEGRPLGDLEYDQDVIEMFGGVCPELYGKAPHMMVLLCAIRTGKSLLSMAHAVYVSQKIDLTGLRPGDGVRISILSTGVDTAKATFRHLAGAIESSPWMNSLKLRETADTIELRHPSGREVEIKVVALSRAGSTLVGRFSAGVVIDEAPRLSSDPDNVETIDEALRAIHGRMLPGATVLLPGSPHVPTGAVYELYEKYFGSPTRECVVAKARGAQLNPFWWTDERQEHVKSIDIETYRTDCLAEFRRAPDALFSLQDLADVTREEMDLKPSSTEYSAALSAGTEANAWYLIVEQHAGHGADGLPRFAITMAREWHASVDNPLRPKRMAQELAALLRPYEIDHVLCAESTPLELIDEAIEAGISLTPEALSGLDLLQRTEEVRTLIESGRYQIPPIKELRRDLLTAKRHQTNTGAIALHLPESSDGRRCPFVPLLAMCRKYSGVDIAEKQIEEDHLERRARLLSENSHDRQASNLSTVSGR